MIPFTRAEFLRVFEEYNDAAWPIYLLGVITFALAGSVSRSLLSVMPFQ